MGQTSKYNLPYPEPTDQADIPKDFKALVEKIEEILTNSNSKLIPTRRRSRTNISKKI